MGVSLVVQITVGGWRVVEVAGRANCALARIGACEAGRHVPVEVVDCLRILGVGLGQFSGEELRLLL